MFNTDFADMLGGRVGERGGGIFDPPPQPCGPKMSAHDDGEPSGGSSVCSNLFHNATLSKNELARSVFWSTT